MWHHLIYPAALLFSIGCLLIVDRRWQLALWQDRRLTLRVMAIAIGYFILWDIAGIALQIFFSGPATYRSGLLLGPNFPLEELAFLTLLVYTSLLISRSLERRP